LTLTTATVVLPVESADAGVQSVMRDLTVAAHALRGRGIALHLLIVDKGEGAGAALARDLAAGSPLALASTRAPVGDAGKAYLEGFRTVLEAGATDVVVTLDANGRHDATQIPRLIEILESSDAHVVIGSRWARGSATPGLTVGRWVLGRLANLAFRIVTGARGVRDATTSFRVCRTETLRDFRFADVPLTSHSVQTAFVANALARGYRVVEAPVIYQPAVTDGGGLALADVAGYAAHLRSLRAVVHQLRSARLDPAGRHFTDEHFGAADDLEQLGTAKYFFDWVLDEFDPWLRGRVLEVGAGFGTITRKLHDRYPSSAIVALEPADNMFEELAAFAAQNPRVEAHCQTLVTYRPDEPFDAAVYLNVLEHIEDDAGELRLAAETLRPGGALLVFGPALEWLYSELDHKAGHYRRYSTTGLRTIVESAGFDIVSLRYFDVLGVLPYWVVYRILGQTTITGGSLWGYDRLVVPLSRAIQGTLRRPPLGKNVILMARKRAA
jgi:SAM-dependent methyltransferase